MLNECFSGFNISSMRYWNYVNLSLIPYFLCFVISWDRIRVPEYTRTSDLFSFHLQISISVIHIMSAFYGFSSFPSIEFVAFLIFFISLREVSIAGSLSVGFFSVRFYIKPAMLLSCPCFLLVKVIFQQLPAFLCCKWVWHLYASHF